MEREGGNETKERVRKKERKKGVGRTQKLRRRDKG